MRGGLRALRVLVVLTACSGRSGERAPDLTALGDRTFRDLCARCHGAAGNGGVSLTPDGPRPRDLSDPVWQASRTDAELAAVIRAGKASMPAYAAVLSAQQIEAVVARLRRLAKEATR